MKRAILSSFILLSCLPLQVGAGGTDMMGDISVMGVRIPDSGPLRTGSPVSIEADSLNVSLVGHWAYGPAIGVALRGDIVWVAAYYDGLRAISISDPANPTEVNSLATSDGAVDVAVSSDYAYVAEMESGMEVVSIADPMNPSQAGYYDTPGWAWRVTTDGGDAYLADQSCGVIVLHYEEISGIGGDRREAPEPPRSFVLSQNHPNPFNPSTTIRVDLPGGAASRATLVIYDLHGRKVRTLVDRPLGAGTHLFTWDGRFDDGASAGSGAYIYRFRRGRESVVKKMLLVK